MTAGSAHPAATAAPPTRNEQKPGHVHPSSLTGAVPPSAVRDKIQQVLGGRTLVPKLENEGNSQNQSTVGNPAVSSSSATSSIPSSTKAAAAVASAAHDSVEKTMLEKLQSEIQKQSQLQHAKQKDLALKRQSSPDKASSHMRSPPPLKKQRSSGGVGAGGSVTTAKERVRAVAELKERMQQQDDESQRRRLSEELGDDRLANKPVVLLDDVFSSPEKTSPEKGLHGVSALSKQQSQAGVQGSDAVMSAQLLVAKKLLPELDIKTEVKSERLETVARDNHAKTTTSPQKHQKRPSKERVAVKSENKQDVSEIIKSIGRKEDFLRIGPPRNSSAMSSSHTKDASGGDSSGEPGEKQSAAAATPLGRNKSAISLSAYRERRPQTPSTTAALSSASEQSQAVFATATASELLNFRTCASGANPVTHTPSVSSATVHKPSLACNELTKDAAIKASCGLVVGNDLTKLSTSSNSDIDQTDAEATLAPVKNEKAERVTTKNDSDISTVMPNLTSESTSGRLPSSDPPQKARHVGEAATRAPPANTKLEASVTRHPNSRSQMKDTKTLYVKSLSDTGRFEKIIARVEEAPMVAAFSSNKVQNQANVATTSTSATVSESGPVSSAGASSLSVMAKPTNDNRATKEKPVNDNRATKEKPVNDNRATKDGSVKFDDARKSVKSEPSGVSVKEALSSQSEQRAAVSVKPASPQVEPGEIVDDHSLSPPTLEPERTEPTVNSPRYQEKLGLKIKLGGQTVVELPSSQSSSVTAASSSSQSQPYGYDSKTSAEHRHKEKRHKHKHKSKHKYDKEKRSEKSSKHRSSDDRHRHKASSSTSHASSAATEAAATHGGLSPKQSSDLKMTLKINKRVDSPHVSGDANKMAAPTSSRSAGDGASAALSSVESSAIPSMKLVLSKDKSGQYSSGHKHSSSSSKHSSSRKRTHSPPDVAERSDAKVARSEGGGANGGTAAGVASLERMLDGQRRLIREKQSSSSTKNREKSSSQLPARYQNP